MDAQYTERRTISSGSTGLELIQNDALRTGSVVPPPVDSPVEGGLWLNWVLGGLVPGHTSSPPWMNEAMRLPRHRHTCSWSWSHLLRFHNEKMLFLGEQVCGRLWTPTLFLWLFLEIGTSPLWFGYGCFLSPPQGCVVCSWSRETSVILTEPWQMPHSKNQHRFEHRQQWWQHCHCQAGSHTAILAASSQGTNLPASSGSCNARTDPTTPSWAGMPSRLESNDANSWDAKESLPVGLQAVVPAGWHAPPVLWAETGLEGWSWAQWAIAGTVLPLHRWKRVTFGLTCKVPRLTSAIFRSQDLGKYCEYV